ncbi:pilus assembly protein TadE [Bifidobacterium aemilianum]|uniref:Pilus assembly protein TadE n=1 Tax=Bifidobacterium aemilianum TaxID=2493120 RepID=A0A366K6G0_9BIFI|nr:TadE family type IV pilus minor pilin [Bifidobacterium aemilianum]RBP97244.1 pilus assembly protein TadE [Bifidobacterium aemilianum]
MGIAWRERARLLRAQDNKQPGHDGGKGHPPQASRGLQALDPGVVTAEFAVVLPAVMLMAMLLLGLARTVTVSMGCQEAAGAAARQLVVTQGRDDVGARVRDVAGSGSTASTSRTSSGTEIRVSCPVIPDPWGVLPTRVEAKAVALDQ